MWTHYVVYAEGAIIEFNDFLVKIFTGQYSVSLLHVAQLVIAVKSNSLNNIKANEIYCLVMILFKLSLIVLG